MFLNAPEGGGITSIGVGYYSCTNPPPRCPPPELKFSMKHSQSFLSICTRICRIEKKQFFSTHRPLEQRSGSTNNALFMQNDAKWSSRPKRYGVV